MSDIQTKAARVWYVIGIIVLVLFALAVLGVGAALLQSALAH